MPTRTARRRPDNRTRAARAEQRDARATLLEAAMEVFSTRGYRDATVDEIADRAGYSKGAVYWHFASKDELFFTLLDERLDRPTRELIELLGSAPAEQDMAPEASEVFARLLEDHPTLILLSAEYWLHAARDPAVAEGYSERRAELRAALASALASRAKTLGAPPSVTDAADDIATVILALSVGLAQASVVDPSAAPARLLGDTIALIYRGLVARAQDAAGPNVG